MWQKYYRYIIGIGILIFLLFVLSYFSEVVSYILISWVLSMIGQPIMGFLLVRLHLLRFPFGKSLAALLTLISMFSILGVLLWLFVPLVIQQAVVLSKVDFNEISLALQEPINKLNYWLRSMGLEPGPSAGDQVKSFIGSYFDPSHISDFLGPYSVKQDPYLLACFQFCLSAFFS